MLQRRGLITFLRPSFNGHNSHLEQHLIFIRCRFRACTLDGQQTTDEFCIRHAK